MGQHGMRALLFSGGMDSSAIAHWLRPDRLLFIDYGQGSSEGENRAAIQIAKELSLPLDSRTVDVQALGSGDLAGRPSIRAESEFWPYRNQFLVTIAAMTYAEANSLDILIGTVRTDVIHPDGSAQFIDALSGLLAVQGRVRLVAPAIGLSTAELIRTSAINPNVLSWAFSCHTGNYACGQCRGCTKALNERRALENNPPPS
jgi:7-cyano-7-deazaguanine synthase